MSKNIEIRRRIAVLEEKLKKSGNSLGIDAGLGNGTVDKWTDKHLDVSNIYVAKFLNHYGINEQWWAFGDGDIFISVDGNNDPITPDKNDVYKTIVEGRTEYVLIPRSVLDKTQLVSSEQINKTWEELEKRNKELEKKNEQIDFYQEQIKKLMGIPELSPRNVEPQEVKKKR